MLDNGVLHCKWETPAADDALATVKDAKCGQKYYMFPIIALTRASRSKCPQDCHTISSWYHRDVYPICFSQLRSPPLMAYQSAIHESTNCSPAKPFFGIYL